MLDEELSWQNKLQDSSEMKELKEFTHYNVMVKLNSTDTPSITIHCELCNKPYKLARRSGKNTMILSNWTGYIKECVISKQQKNSANAEENPQTSMKIPKIQQQTLSRFIKSQKSVDHQVIQSQSASKSEVIYQPSTISSKISSKEMSKPASNQIGDEADCHISPNISCN